MSDRDEILEATSRWYEALNAMFDGDPAPLDDIYSHADDVSYMPAQGGLVVGWDAVRQSWTEQAAASHGGHVEPVETWVGLGSDLAVAMVAARGWTIEPDGTKTENQVRESSVFRKEPEGWRIIAHHADALPGWAGVMGSDA